MTETRQEEKNFFCPSELAPCLGAEGVVRLVCISMPYAHT